MVAGGPPRWTFGGEGLRVGPFRGEVEVLGRKRVSISVSQEQVLTKGRRHGIDRWVTMRPGEEKEVFEARITRGGG